MKKGPLSKLEKSYIQQNIDDDVETIADELNRSVNTVSKFIDSLPKDEKTLRQTEQEQATTKVYEDEGGVESQFSKSVARRKRNGQLIATVMTPGASEAADDARPQLKTTRHTKDAVFQPLSDNDMKERKENASGQ